MNMKFLKYSIFAMIAIVFFSCKKEETFTFSDKPSFEFADTVSSAPVGFVTTGSLQKQYRIYLVGSLPETDIKLKLNYSGVAKNGVDFNMPTELIFPKGATEVMLPCEAFSNTTATTDIDFKVQIMVTDENVKSINHTLRIKIEYGMPTQWVGYDNDHYYGFMIDFTKCTKAKYQFFYRTFGFYDFSTLPEYKDPMGTFRTVMQAYKAAANQQIKIEREAGAILKDDDGSDLKF